MGNKRHIAVCSTVHQFDDPRVFHRQAQTLSKRYETHLYVCAPFRWKLINSHLKIWGLPIWKKKSDRVRNILQLVSYLWKENASIYILHDPELLIIVPFLKFFKKGKIIYDIHENYREMIEDKLWIPKPIRSFTAFVYSKVESVMLHWMDMIWYPVKNIGDHYHSISISKYLIRNVPPLSKFKFPLQKAKKNWILFLGHLIDDRGILEIIEAFSQISKKFPQYQLIFVGEFQSEPFKTKIFNFIDDLGLKRKIVFRGRIPYDEVPQVLAASQIGLLNYLPNLNNMMGLPNKLFEYMAAGIPVIASDFENYREVIETANCGLLVDPTKPEQIAKALFQLIENPQLRQELGKNGQNAFRNHFCWEKEEAKIFSAIDELNGVS